MSGNASEVQYAFFVFNVFFVRKTACVLNCHTKMSFISMTNVLIFIKRENCNLLGMCKYLCIYIKAYNCGPMKCRRVTGLLTNRTWYLNTLNKYVLRFITIVNWIYRTVFHKRTGLHSCLSKQHCNRFVLKVYDVFVI